MQQRKFQHIRRLGQAVAPRKKLGTANREQLLGAQAGNVESRPIAVAVPDGEIDVLTREVDVMQRRRNPQVDIRVRLREPAEAVDEPLRGKVGRGAHRQHTRALALDQALRADGDTVEGIAQNGKIRATGLGDDQPLALAVEELEAQFHLQGLHLVAHGTLGDAKLLRGSREALVPCRGFERLQRVEGRKTAQHRRTIMRKPQSG